MNTKYKLKLCQQLYIHLISVSIDFLVFVEKTNEIRLEGKVIVNQ